MIEIEKPRIETEELSEDGSYGRFVVEPLERGYGTTLGNSLRRVLLSSLPGVAATSVKFDGVVHEFSTIDGVKEDVTEIVLNLKGLTAKIHGDGPKIVYIEAEGPGTVTAADIKLDHDVEIVNGDHVIANLADKGALNMKLRIAKYKDAIEAAESLNGINAFQLFQHIHCTEFPLIKTCLILLRHNKNIEHIRCEIHWQRTLAYL